MKEGMLHLPKVDKLQAKLGVQWQVAAAVCAIGICTGVVATTMVERETVPVVCKTIVDDGNARVSPIMLARMDHSPDEHAKHRQMMQRKGYTRTAHAYTVPDLTLRDSDGRATTLTQALDTDKPVMLNFIYTTCTTICPVLSATFSQVQRDLGQKADSVQMISISIDPDRDTPSQLRKYAKQFDAGPQWTFITGQHDRIVEVQKAFDIYRGAKTNHEPVTLLRAAGAESWVRIEGIASAKEIIDEYNALPAMTQ